MKQTVIIKIVTHSYSTVKIYMASTVFKIVLELLKISGNHRLNSLMMETFFEHQSKPNTVIATAYRVSLQKLSKVVCTVSI